MLYCMVLFTVMEDAAVAAVLRGGLHEGPGAQGHSEDTWVSSWAKAPDWHYPNELQLQH